MRESTYPSKSQVYNTGYLLSGAPNPTHPSQFLRMQDCALRCIRSQVILRLWVTPSGLGNCAQHNNHLVSLFPFLALLKFAGPDTIFAAHLVVEKISPRMHSRTRWITILTLPSLLVIICSSMLIAKRHSRVKKAIHSHVNRTKRCASCNLWDVAGTFRGDALARCLKDPIKLSLDLFNKFARKSGSLPVVWCRLEISFKSVRRLVSFPCLQQVRWCIRSKTSRYTRSTFKRKRGSL
jgi:hypothetical protein